MPFKNPEDRRRNDRERRRKERAGAVEMVEGEEKIVSDPLPLKPTVGQVTAALAEQINLVRQSGTETLSKARAVGYLGGVLLKALEVGSIEERLALLEEKIGKEKS